MVQVDGADIAKRFNVINVFSNDLEETLSRHAPCAGDDGSH